MRHEKLDRQARIALTLTGFYWAAESLCAIFVAVFLLRTGQDFNVVFKFYTAVYTLTPFVFLLAGWYAQARDRLHMYRLGLLMHGVYYGSLLILRERAPDYVILLGILLGITWGCFHAGANTIAFDVTTKGRREYYFGMVSAVTSSFQLVAPIVGGLIISYSPGDHLTGYYHVFAIVLGLYVCSFGMTYLMPKDSERRPYNIRRALFPGKDQRDWRLVMLASASLAGSFSIFQFLLGMLMFLQTGNELSVGGYASFQAVIGILMSYYLGRTIAPRLWKRCLFWGTAILIAGGLVVSWQLSTLTLIVFGITRTVSGTLIGIPHNSLRFEVISKSVLDPAERIEYISAWEVPLAVGRIIMMTILMALYTMGSIAGLQFALLLLCGVRVVTYLLLTRTDTLRNAETTPLPAAQPQPNTP
ncbi:MAG: MFS transporter [FCB group bacterium]|jgi:YQGE family putative transporter|nr:MFS transporter [FCB group bacterium]